MIVFCGDLIRFKFIHLKALAIPKPTDNRTDNGTDDRTESFTAYGPGPGRSCPDLRASCAANSPADPQA